MKNILLLLGILLAGCSGTNSNKKNIEDTVTEWMGKTILYPQTMKYSVYGVDTVIGFDRNYSIVTYVDSMGCMSCKLQLSKWTKVMQEFDSITHKAVNFIFIIHTTDKKELLYMLKRERFAYPVCIDEADSTNQLNHFPSEMSLQTFLLDKDNKVIAMGNPAHNPKVKELYLNVLTGNKDGATTETTQTTTELSKSVVDMGKFPWKLEQEEMVTLKNTGDMPLVVTDIVTSCGCITTEYPKEPLLAGRSVDIRIIYRGTHPEHFNKTVTIYCNAANSPLKLKVTGEAQ